MAHLDWHGQGALGNFPVGIVIKEGWREYTGSSGLWKPRCASAPINLEKVWPHTTNTPARGWVTPSRVKWKTLTPWPVGVVIANGSFKFIIFCQWFVGYYDQDVRETAMKFCVFIIWYLVDKSGVSLADRAGLVPIPTPWSPPPFSIPFWHFFGVIFPGLISSEDVLSGTPHWYLWDVLWWHQMISPYTRFWSSSCLREDWLVPNWPSAGSV